MKNIWRFNDFWKYTNLLWYISNILISIVFLLALFLHEIWRYVLILRELHFLKYGLPKKDEEFFRELVKNYENWTSRVKDMEKFKRDYWVNIRAYDYCKMRIKEIEDEKKGKQGIEL